MRRLASLCVVSVVACAGSNATPEASPAPVEQHVQISTAGSQTSLGSSLNLVPSSGLTSHHFAAPIEQVWKVLPAVFDSLGVPVGLLDPRAHAIGNNGFKVRGKLGKVGLARYIDCGTTQIGPNAESYDITLTLTTTLSSTPDGATAMSMNLLASAKPMAFGQDAFPCSSKGALEKRVTDLVTTLTSR